MKKNLTDEECEIILDALFVLQDVCSKKEGRINHAKNSAAQYAGREKRDLLQNMIDKVHAFYWPRPCEGCPEQIERHEITSCDICSKSLCLSCVHFQDVDGSMYYCEKCFKNISGFADIVS